MEQIKSVSVVIPNYNCLATLPRAIESIRLQACDTEIIVIDDGSTDGSRDWLAQQSDIKVIYTERAGASGARNLAISHCRYELIAFLDADDYWLEGKLSRQLDQHLTNPEIVFSFTDYQHVSESGNSIIGCFDFWPRFQRLITKSQMCHIIREFTPALFAENVVGTSTVLVQKKALIKAGGFDAHLKSASDWELWLKLSLQGPVGVVNLVLTHYTSDRLDAISRNHERRLLAMKHILFKYTHSVRQHPSSLLAGYLRWITGKAEYNRIQKAYLTAMCQELFVFCFQPHWRRAKAAGGDFRRIMSPK